MLLSIFGKESALRERDFWFFFLGQSISQIGTWLQVAALGWYIFQTTHSQLLVVFNGALLMVSASTFALVAGVVIDAHKTRHVLVVTNILGMVQATVMAVLMLAHSLTLWEINVLTAVLGAINAFDGPTRQAAISELVPLDDVPSATGINMSLVSAAMMLGPALAGLIIWREGTAMPFVWNAVSFIAVIWTVLMMKFKYASEKSTTIPWGSIVPSIKLCFWENKTLRSLLVLVFLTLTFCFPYRTLMPVITTVLLHGSIGTFGLVGAMPGAGAVLGGIVLSRYSKRVAFKTFVIGGWCLVGFGLASFSVLHSAYVAMPALFLAGAGMIISMGMLRSKVQVLARQSHGLLGRVSSLSQMVFLCGIAFGNTAVGQVAQRFGLAFALCACGIALLVLAAFLLLRPKAIEQFE